MAEQNAAAATAAAAADAAPVASPSAAAAAAPASSSSSTLPQSVHYTPLAHILPEFVPEQWTVTFPAANAAEAQSADDAAAASAAATAAAALSPPQHGIDGSVLPRIWQHPSSLVVTRVNLAPLMLRVDNFLSAAECAEVLRMAYDPAAPAWKPYRNITYKPQRDSTGAVIAQKFEVGYSEAATLFQLDCQLKRRTASSSSSRTHEHSAVLADCSHARPLPHSNSSSWMPRVRR